MRQAQLNLTPDQSSDLDQLGWQFLADILEAEIERHPRNVEALAELGQIYTRQGRIERGLAVDRELVRLVPESPTVHYNLACSFALLGAKRDALAALEKSIELGYDDPDYMQNDADLSSVADEERFQMLLRKLREAAPQQR